jgi:hypothetical protein
MRRVWRFGEAEVRRAVAASSSFAETLRRLGLGPSGGNWRTLQRYCRDWGIPTDHFDPYAASRGRRGAVPLEQVLVAGSNYPRKDVKRRLFEQGIKARRCELCGQGELWRGRRMALIIDHINGIRDDHRLENLRIVCPNCAATLETHCGRRNHLTPRRCAECEREFKPRSRTHRFCSRPCAARRPRASSPRPDLRRVERPSEADLLAEIRATSLSAVGRRYGVSATAVRKWVASYERARLRGGGPRPAGSDPG